MCKAVSAVIIHKGKLLIQDHVKLNKLTVPSGSIEVGEEPQAALARELKEELGVENFKVSYWHAVRHDEIETVEFRYYVTLEDKWHNAEPEKHRSIKWMTPYEIANSDMQCSVILKDVLNCTTITVDTVAVALSSMRCETDFKICVSKGDVLCSQES